jgi:steroid 5-alpha reductase family enzyme
MAALLYKQLLFLIIVAKICASSSESAPWDFKGSITRKTGLLSPQKRSFSKPLVALRLKRNGHHQYTLSLRGGSQDVQDNSVRDQEMDDDLQLTATQAESSAAFIDEQMKSTNSKPSRSMNLFRETMSLVKDNEYTQSTLSSVTPALFALWSSKQPSFVTLYALSLLGSSVGFYRFLYFTSLGYALGILLPTLALFLRHPTLQSFLVCVWGVRLASFLMWREHVSWPQLHCKIQHVHEQQSSPQSPAVKLMCWFVSSFAYVCMISPCIWQHAINSSVRLETVRRSLGLLLQLFGLSLESIADYQKCKFKALYRHEWCREGVWALGRHPNYAGEWLFWLGTFLQARPNGVLHVAIMTIGFVFVTAVIYGAAMYLSDRQTEKYGSDSNFVTFQKTHGILGPRLPEIVSLNAVVFQRSLKGANLDDNYTDDAVNAPVLAEDESLAL